MKLNHWKAINKEVRRAPTTSVSFVKNGKFSKIGETWINNFKVNLRSGSIFVWL